MKIQLEHLTLCWRAGRKVPYEAAGTTRHMPRAHEVGQVTQRVAECRELPIQHRHYSRLARMKDEIAKSIVAVNHACRLIRGSARVLQEALGELLLDAHHRFTGPHDGLFDWCIDRPYERVARLKLTIPRAYLAVCIAPARLAVLLQPDGAHVDGVQLSKHLHHMTPDRSALLRRLCLESLRRSHPVEDSSRHVLHRVPRDAEHGLIGAQKQRPRHGHTRTMQSGKHAVLAEDVVS
mmetsp:Transcript_11209/g.26920  ORF Transcript_11209/g.26920 Transcript_11209/m.26920 type:complete len:236 (+) Transcript_11209:431-1138(+)